MGERPTLLPAENIALTVALAQLERGDDVMPNIAAVCVSALVRIVRPEPELHMHGSDCIDRERPVYGDDGEVVGWATLHTIPGDPPSPPTACQNEAITGTPCPNKPVGWTTRIPGGTTDARLWLCMVHMAVAVS